MAIEMYQGKQEAAVCCRADSEVDGHCVLPDGALIATLGKALNSVVETAVSASAVLNKLTIDCTGSRLHAAFENRQHLSWMPAVIHYLASELRSDYLASKSINSLLGRIVGSRRVTPLVIGRRAFDLSGRLTGSRERGIMSGALARAELDEIVFYSTLDNAIRRNPEAHVTLIEMARRLIGVLPDARGRQLSQDTCLHVAVLFFRKGERLDGKITYSDEAEDYVDVATRATRAEIGRADFHPKYALKVLRELESAGAR